MQPIPDLSDPMIFLLAVFGVSVVVFFRYVLIAGGFYFFFYRIARQHFTRRKISFRLRQPGQSWREVKWSALTSFAFGLAGALMLLAWQKGYTRIYTEPDAYGYAWLPVSLLIAMLLHETYYYWLHRWMHRPGVFRIIHKVHHDSLVTSPWTSFSFHPLESVLQAVVVPALTFALPFHYAVLVVLLTAMTISATINHLDIEIYPKGTSRHWLGRWLIGATHHSLHHLEFRTNYGLYFTFWDKWMGTESNKYETLIEEKTGG
ncbi:MAG: sterol desaturase family protein [Saprospiraceae bacterium]|nr:sterol desaturase family protein [Saprospiraceae bacterium]